MKPFTLTAPDHLSRDDADQRPYVKVRLVEHGESQVMSTLGRGWAGAFHDAGGNLC